MGWFFDVYRDTYELLAQIREYGSYSCRVNPYRCPRTSSEIHAAGEREVRVYKGGSMSAQFLGPTGAIEAGTGRSEFDGRGSATAIAMRMSAESHAAGEPGIRIMKAFRRWLNYLPPGAWMTHKSYDLSSIATGVFGYGVASFSPARTWRQNRHSTAILSKITRLTEALPKNNLISVSNIKITF